MRSPGAVVGGSAPDAPAIDPSTGDCSSAMASSGAAGSEEASGGATGFSGRATVGFSGRAATTARRVPQLAQNAWPFRTADEQVGQRDSITRNPPLKTID
jgi:hypothetical protein